MDVVCGYINELLTNVVWMNNQIRNTLEVDVRYMLHDAINSHIIVIKDMLSKLPTEY